MEKQIVGLYLNPVEHCKETDFVTITPFYRAGGFGDCSGTYCRVALQHREIILEFCCKEGNPAYRITSNGKEAMTRRDQVEVVLQGNGHGQWDFCVFSVARDGTSSAFEEIGMTYLGGGEAYTGGTSKKDAGIRRNLPASAWMTELWQEENAWGCTMHIPLELFRADNRKPFHLQLYRKKHQTSEVLCPTPLDLNVNYSDRFEYDPLTFLEVYPGAESKLIYSDAIYTTLPSGTVRWGRAGKLQPLENEEFERICQWQREQAGSFAECILLAQRWQDALELDGVDFFFNQTISHPWEFLEPWVERTQVNLCLAKGDMEGAKIRLNRYLKYLNRLTAWWYADHTLGNRGMDWLDFGDLSDVAENPEGAIHLNYTTGISLSVAAAVGGVRIYSGMGGYFQAEGEKFSYHREESIHCFETQRIKIRIVTGKNWCIHINGVCVMQRVSLRMRTESGRSCFDVRLPLPEKGIVTGFGERFDGVNQRNRRLFLWQRDACEGCLAGIGNQAYKNIPIVSVENGFTLFANHLCKQWMDVGCTQKSELRMVLEDGFLDLFYWDLPTQTALHNYCLLTGMPLLPPKWVFEPWAGGGGGRWLHGPLKDLYREQYGVLAKFRQEDIPHSGFYGEGAGAGWSGKVQKEELYKITAFADSMGIRVFSWQYPNMSKEEAQKLLPDCPESELPITHGPEGLPSYIDFTHPRAEELLQAQWRDRLDAGIRGSMVDFGDVVPDEALFYDGRDGRTMHNGYALTYAKAYRKLFLSRYGTDHVLYTRGAGAGSQAYACQFAGDHLTSFQGMRYAISGGITAAMSGLPFWGSDAGGYDGFGDEETYLRWTEFSCFNPIMRFHGTAPREPWEYSRYAVAVYRYYAWLRENLLPYAWHNAQLAHKCGMSILRPMQTPADEELPDAAYDTQFYYGSELLVAPVCQEGESRTVFLPEGKWYHLLDAGKILPGGCYTMDVPMHSIPVFARAGACIPLRLNENLRLGSSMTPGSHGALLLTHIHGRRNGTRYTDTGSYDYIVSGDKNVFEFQADGLWADTYVLIRGVKGAKRVMLGDKTLPCVYDRGGLLTDEAWCFLEDGTLAVRCYPREGLRLLVQIESCT